ncbi:hypothetical protein P152DRAFT_451480 [Eremomyces bilateralis CBS 781.70]|uniref:Uncharacterized protein n=1 Tax=Eremomyces bilateralis CBS 781.70 TaxID=1392243 RepID=A0A6G1FWN3_9PEZI|nr:uncharacterized protein P152DRAFT_451480 [Eremomyces bilateralis CBS 781.70]KAF1810112.1 hypothetical protein P152DRAFT_451480 [Eremomyces bilateralis CBS 781.70]
MAQRPPLARISSPITHPPYVRVLSTYFVAPWQQMIHRWTTQRYSDVFGDAGSLGSEANYSHRDLHPPLQYLGRVAQSGRGGVDLAWGAIDPKANHDHHTATEDADAGGPSSVKFKRIELVDSIYSAPWKDTIPYQPDKPYDEPASKSISTTTIRSTVIVYQTTTLPTP